MKKRIISAAGGLALLAVVVIFFDTLLVNFLAAGISITEEKQQVMDFTNEYYEATQAIVVLK